jgi:hypothetical protein
MARCLSKSVYVSRDLCRNIRLVNERAVCRVHFTHSATAVHRFQLEETSSMSVQHCGGVSVCSGRKMII